MTLGARDAPVWAVEPDLRSGIHTLFGPCVRPSRRFIPLKAAGACSLLDSRVLTGQGTIPQQPCPRILLILERSEKMYDAPFSQNPLHRACSPCGLLMVTRRVKVNLPIDRLAC